METKEKPAAAIRGLSINNNYQVNITEDFPGINSEGRITGRVLLSGSRAGWWSFLNKRKMIAPGIKYCGEFTGRIADTNPLRIEVTHYRNYGSQRAYLDITRPLAHISLKSRQSHTLSGFAIGDNVKFSAKAFVVETALVHFTIGRDGLQKLHQGGR